MFIALACLAIVALIALALYSTTKAGGGGTVTETDVGGINAFESYYGKDKHTYPKGAPCEVCAPKGCMGNGLCRCKCHQAAAA
ncbi:MAG: hypothetical protein ACOZIN_03825 [Myxococcota bacterium]